MNKVKITTIAFILSIAFTGITAYADTCSNIQDSINALSSETSTPEATQISDLQSQYGDSITTQDAANTQALSYFDQHYTPPNGCSGADDGVHCGNALSTYNASRQSIIDSGNTSVAAIQSEENSAIQQVQTDFTNLTSLQFNLSECEANNQVTTVVTTLPLIQNTVVTITKATPIIIPVKTVVQTVVPEKIALQSMSALALTPVNDSITANISTGVQTVPTLVVSTVPWYKKVIIFFTHIF